MTQPSKDKLDEKPTISALLGPASRIWLAGLGAFARAQQESGRLFETLVKEGEALEALTRKTADDMFAEMKGKVEAVRGNATEKLDRLEQAFQDRVARALGRLGVPTNDDIQEIARRIEALSDSLRQLSSKK
jgi:poly(hydroxyalkanoate) granule-associated protein